MLFRSISAFGFQTYDCHHSPIGTEIHPPVLTAVHRARPVRIPDGWAPPGGEPLGSGIWVPGIVTDIWANARAGEISSNCSSTGMHQEATLAPPGSQFPILYGACIQSPHPIRRNYSFSVYLPENPQARVAAAGLNPPPAPLHVRVEPGSGPVPFIVPCHRVVRSDYSLGKYSAAGGTDTKRAVLSMEGLSDHELSWIQHAPRFVATIGNGEFCLPACGGFDTADPRQLRGFDHAEEALEAGFEPCDLCKPM